MFATLLIECAENISGVTDSHTISYLGEMSSAFHSEDQALAGIITITESKKLRRFFYRAYRDMKLREFPHGMSRAHIVRTDNGPVFYYASVLNNNKRRVQL